MKKKLNTESITNELEGASLFFTKSTTPPSLPEPDKQIFEKYISPTPDSPTLPKDKTPNLQSQNEENQDQKRSNDRTFERPSERTEKPKREKIRHTFDIYKDQLMAPQVIQLEAVQSGKKKPKLGSMVSKGIDLFIKQSAFKKQRA